MPFAANKLKLSGPGEDKTGKAFGAQAAAETRGTFSGAVAAMLGGGASVGERQLSELEKWNARSDQDRAYAAQHYSEQHGILREIRDWLKQMGVI